MMDSSNGTGQSFQAPVDAPIDSRNISRDESEMGNDNYFIESNKTMMQSTTRRHNTPTESITQSEQRNTFLDLRTSLPSEIKDLVRSSSLNSLVGEDIVTSGNNHLLSDGRNNNKAEAIHVEDLSVNCDEEDEEANHFDNLQSNNDTLSEQNFLQHSGIIEKSPKESKLDYNDAYIFSPSILSTSDNEHDGSVITTPPSVTPNYPSSPPRLILNNSNQYDQQQLHELYEIHVDERKKNHHQSSIESQSNNLVPQGAGLAINNEFLPLQQQQQQQQQNRPPRIPSSKGTSNKGSMNEQNKRTTSSGDYSFLSALTDSEYEGAISGNSSINQPNNNGKLSSRNEPISPIPLPNVLLPREQNSTHHYRRSSFPSFLVPGFLSQESSQLDDNVNKDPSVVSDILKGLHMHNVSDIPAALQQPILAGEKRVKDLLSELSGRFGDDNNEQQQNECNKKVDPPPSKITTKPSPSRFDDAKDIRRETARRHHRQNLNKISEFETEAEQALLEAIEQELKKADTKDDMTRALFPGIPDEASIQFEAFDDNKSKQGDTAMNCRNPVSNLTTTRMQWIAFQQAANNDDMPTSSFQRKPSLSINASMNSSCDILLHNVEIFQNVSKSKIKVKESFETADISEIGARTSTSQGHGAQDEIGSNDVEAGKNVVDNTNDSNNPGSPKTPIHISIQLKRKFERNMQQMISDWDAFHEYFQPSRNPRFYRIVRNLLIYCMIPSFGMSFILFYVSNNPPTGTVSMPSQYFSPNRASASWWLLFLGVRQPILLCMAKATEMFFVDFLGVSSRRFMKVTGPQLGLLITQSKGWPSVLFFWAVYAFILLEGPYPLANHWLFWQNTISIFSSENPSGNITARPMYIMSLISAIIVGFAVSVKRLAMGFVLGRTLHARYNEHLTAVMEKMVSLSEISSLVVFNDFLLQKDVMSYLIKNPTDDGTPGRSKDTDETTSKAHEEKIIKDSVFQKTSSILHLLEEWEELEKTTEYKEQAQLSEILEFRQTFILMQTRYPFSIYFGLADTRKSCIESSEKVFKKLLRRQKAMGIEKPDDMLDFRLLSEIAVNNDGETDEEKVKSLIRLLRPNRNGDLSLIDFAQSVDSVYRELRTLSANIRNASALHLAYEKLFDVVFYFVLILLVLAIMGINGFEIFYSISTFIVVFAFAIGPACSQYLEGILLILVRKPYDIGDRISLSHPEGETNAGGSNGWIVEGIGLYSTTLRFGMTREVCTVANGSISRSRIINMNRSDKPNVMIHLKFGVDVPYQKILIFQTAVEKFVYGRPREWMKSLGFRSTRVEADLGYIEYVLILQHRSLWQEVGAVLESRARVASFCLELLKQLDMKYHSPPMPIELNMTECSNALNDGNVQNRKVRNSDDEDILSSGANTITSGHRKYEDKVNTVSRLFETKKVR